MTTFSVHQWRGLEGGLRELRRVVRGPVLVLSCDPTLLDRAIERLRMGLAEAPSHVWGL